MHIIFLVENYSPKGVSQSITQTHMSNARLSTLLSLLPLPSLSSFPFLFPLDISFLLSHPFFQTLPSPPPSLPSHFYPCPFPTPFPLLLYLPSPSPFPSLFCLTDALISQILVFFFHLLPMRIGQLIGLFQFLCFW